MFDINECRGAIRLRGAGKDLQQRNTIAWECLQCHAHGEYWKGCQPPPIGTFRHEPLEPYEKLTDTDTIPIPIPPTHNRYDTNTQIKYEFAGEQTLTFAINRLDARHPLTITLARETHTHTHTLSAAQAENLLEWLYQQRDTIFDAGSEASRGL